MTKKKVTKYTRIDPKERLPRSNQESLPILAPACNVNHLLETKNRSHEPREKLVFLYSCNESAQDQPGTFYPRHNVRATLLPIFAEA